MRTSLIEIERIENWLLKKGDIGERLFTEARILTNKELKENADWQSTTYQMIELYGREQLLEEVKAVERELFQSHKHRSFQERIRSIFKR